MVAVLASRYAAPPIVIIVMRVLGGFPQSEYNGIVHAGIDSIRQAWRTQENSIFRMPKMERKVIYETYNHSENNQVVLQSGIIC